MSIIESPVLPFHTGIGVNSAALLYVGGIRSMKNIAKGDVILGDNMKPRIILEIGCKEADAVIINPDIAESFIVGKEHLLTLYSDSTGQTIDIKVCDYIQKTQVWKDKFKLFYIPIEYPAVRVCNDPYLIGMLLNIKSSGKHKMPKDELVEFAIKHYLNMRLNNLESYMSGVSADMKMFINGTFDKNEISQIIQDSSEHLFIPESYLYNSIGVRFRLLHGFLEANKQADEWFRSKSKSPGSSRLKSPMSSKSGKSNESGKSNGSNRSNRSNSADPPERKIMPPVNKKGLEKFARLSILNNTNSTNNTKPIDEDDNEVPIIGKKYNDTFKLNKKEPRSRLSKFQSKIPKLGQTVSVAIADQFFGKQMKFLVCSLGFKCVFSNSELTSFDSLARLKPANEKITMNFTITQTNKTFLYNIKSNDGEHFILSNGIVMHK